jgi:hypothetical protein
VSSSVTDDMIIFSNKNTSQKLLIFSIGVIAHVEDIGFQMD